MIPLPVPNTRAHPYRGLSVQEVDVPLDERSVLAYLQGREVYRRTDFLALRNGGATVLVAVRKESVEPLFSPVVEARVLAGVDETAWVESPETDVGNATALAAAAVPGARVTVVLGRFQHVNFLWEPAPIRVRVTEVVPPHPPKLFLQAQQVVAYDEDLPPVELVLDAVDVHDLAAANPAAGYLLPCRGSGTDLGAPVEFLDTRPPERHDWTLIGCERSVQFHRHFYGDEPPRVDLCPRKRVEAGRADGGADGPANGNGARTPSAEHGVTLTKCCLIERGLEVDGDMAVVPWGTTLDEIRDGLRAMLLPLAPEAVQGLSPSVARIEAPG
ncbi:hypothetical protein [Kineosporia sp. A_224]|uniref:DUF7714 family protein n=1 Tax=Kineosporia sp. A_224 TaxID=1962180 RepID=UPI0018EA02DD|nr:hypothetical protein [Kineosporia sp. A_224]